MGFGYSGCCKKNTVYNPRQDCIDIPRHDCIDPDRCASMKNTCKIISIRKHQYKGHSYAETSVLQPPSQI